MEVNLAGHIKNADRIFKENGALQRMTEAAGETWTGPDSIDNYC